MDLKDVQFQIIRMWDRGEITAISCIEGIVAVQDAKELTPRKVDMFKDKLRKKYFSLQPVNIRPALKERAIDCYKRKRKDQYYFLKRWNRGRMTGTQCIESIVDIEKLLFI